VEGYAAPSLQELESKLAQFPAGTVFRWCPQAWNPTDAFSPGEREEMFRELAGFLAPKSMGIEPYAREKCESIVLK